MRSLIIVGAALLFFSVLTEAATSQQRGWSDVLSAGGKVYVLRGSETNKTANLLTGCGFKKFTFPVRRDFELYDQAQPDVILEKFVQKSEECDQATYDYFPEDHAVIASYDSSSPIIENLKKQKSFRVKGLIMNLRQRQCRFALSKDYDTKRMFIYNKLTGTMKPLSPEALAFVGDTWQTDLFLIEDGAMLAKVVSDYASKQFIVSTWDLARNSAGPKSSKVGFGEYQEPSVVFVARQGNGLTFLFGGPGETDRAAKYTLTQGVFTSGALTRRIVYVSDHSAFEGLVSVVPNGGQKVMIVHHLVDGFKARNNRWTTAVLDLSTGTTQKSETFAVPVSQ